MQFSILLLKIIRSITSFQFYDKNCTPPKLGLMHHIFSVTFVSIGHLLKFQWPLLKIRVCNFLIKYYWIKLFVNFSQLWNIKYDQNSTVKNKQKIYEIILILKNWHAVYIFLYDFFCQAKQTETTYIKRNYGIEAIDN